MRRLKQDANIQTDLKYDKYAYALHVKLIFSALLDTWPCQGAWPSCLYIES